MKQLNKLKYVEKKIKLMIHIRWVRVKSFKIFDKLVERSKYTSSTTINPCP